MAYREPPDRAACVEALTVIIEAYGLRRTREMMEEAAEVLRKEREEEEAP